MSKLTIIFQKGKIRVVMDNPTAHKLGSLHEIYPPEEARRIGIHYTPKHPSWVKHD
ncbi:MAG: hypothetical protein P0S93_01330 [Candidatus Neptunochlamydia sp.]|nr:hypothetical protein [Candidatus Neptunochlamydia sp.]